MVTSALIAFGIVAVAELGDKSQLVAMTYALRHRWWVILSGVGLAALIVHGISVAVGHFLGVTLPDRPIAFAAAVAFFIFAAWTWRGGRLDGGVPGPAPEHRFVLLAVISSVVLAELGDKTMLATVAVSRDHNWAGVWIGATVGMVVADGLAIAVGALLHRRLPERFLHGLASLLFLVFGLWLLFDGALGWRWVAVSTVAAAASGACAMAVWTRLREVRQTKTTVPTISTGRPN